MRKKQPEIIFCGSKSFKKNHFQMEMVSKKVISKWKSFTYHMTFLKRSWKEMISFWHWKSFQKKWNVTFKTKLIHCTFGQTFQIIEVWLTDEQFFFQKFCKKFWKQCLRIWRKKDFFFWMTSFRKIDFFAIFANFSFHQTDLDSTLFQPEKLIFYLFKVFRFLELISTVRFFNGKS